MINAMYKIGVFFLGKNFLKGNRFIDFIRDSLRLFIFMFLPWVILGFTLIIETIMKGIIK